MVHHPRISVLIPLYRGRDTIKQCLESLLMQDGVELQILLLDNGCPEGSGELAGYLLGGLENPPEWKLLEVKNNIGFAAGMNKLYAESDAAWICFLNQDVTLNPDHLKILVSELTGNQDLAGVCGTLYRAAGEGEPLVLDTTGHEIFRDRIVRNRGAGRVIDDGLIPYEEGEVFGLSAACSVFSRIALEGTREVEGPFDPDFYSYFEDVDLDYRINRAGWKLGYVPQAAGTHLLAGSGGRRELKIRLRAYGNRRRIMWKHETPGSLWPDIIPILVQDIYGSIRALFTDPIAWLIGPMIFLGSIGRILKRRRELDIRFGTARGWIRRWLKSERERIQGRNS